MIPVAGVLIANRYELVERICITRMNTVFKAWDFQQQRWVVVKIAITSVSNRRLIERLRCEARALQRLSHPRIVRLLDSGYYDDSYFLVLEYLQGVDMSFYLKTHFLMSLHAVIVLGVELLEALEVVHQQGLVHRDIKPENIIITAGGIKLIDFGLVKFLNPDGRPQRRLTNPGFLMGTLPYLSPEQAYDGEVDGRSDLYVCGIVLYEALTGTFPFADEEFIKGKALARFWNTPMRMFSEAAPLEKIPDDVQAAVWKALSIDPDDRYQTAAEMREALLVVCPSVFKDFLQEAPVCNLSFEDENEKDEI